MTGILTRSANGNGKALADGQRYDERPRRSNRQVAVGVLSVVLGAFLAWLGYLALDDTEPVVAVARDLPSGHVLTAEDLRIVRISSDRVASVPSKERATLIGRSTAVPLAGGSLLVRSQVAPEGATSGGVLVGVPLDHERLPGPVKVGDVVRVVDTGESNSAPGNPVVLVEEAAVFAITELADSAGSVLTISVTSQDAAARVAAASAADRVALILLTARS